MGAFVKFNVFWHWLHRIPVEPRILAALGVLSALLLVFGNIAEEVLEGETGDFDRSTLLLFRDAGDLSDPLGPAWLEKALSDVTVLGNPSILTLVTVIAAAYLLVVGRVATAALVAVAIASGSIAEVLLKAGFDRARPDLVPHLVEVTSLSFPSGHAMLSALTYLTIGALLAKAQTQRRARFFVLATGVLLTALISFSRVYLGVHWPTDVLAGWAAGSIWALLFWLLADRWGLPRRR